MASRSSVGISVLAFTVACTPASSLPTGDAGTTDARSVADATTADAGLQADGGPAEAATVERVAPSCPVAPPAGASCEVLRVTVPGLAPLEVHVRTFPPAGTEHGTILLGSGGAGTEHYAGSPRELDLVARLTAAGFRVLDRAWQGPSGFFAGEGGLRSVARRYAALVGWARDRWPTGAMCASGSSGGAVELAYGLVAGANLDLAVPSSGPFHSLAVACGAPDPTWPDTCRARLAESCPSCDASRCGTGAPPDIRALIDEAYGGEHVCTGDPATVDAARLDGDGLFSEPVDVDGAVVRIVVGGRDPSGLPAFALETAARLVDAGVEASSEVVLDAGHTVAASSTGADALFSILSTECVPR